MTELLADFSNVDKYLSGTKFDSNFRLLYTKQSVVRFRNDVLVDACRKKKVLHIGCCDHIPLVGEKIKSGQWLHAQLTSVAEEAIGIDIDAEAIVKVRALSALDNVFWGDITKRDLISKLCGKKFDVAIFGEVVEHIGNPVNFLSEFVNNYGRNCSEIIITVPNAFRAGNIRNIFSHQEVINSDHRFFFTPYTITKIAVDSQIEPLKIEMASFTERRSVAKRVALNAWPLLAENIIFTGALGRQGRGRHVPNQGKISSKVQKVLKRVEQTGKHETLVDGAVRRTGWLTLTARAPTCPDLRGHAQVAARSGSAFHTFHGAIHTVRQNIKRLASQFGIEVMTRRGLQNLEHDRCAAVVEYLRLLAKIRGTDLPKSKDRIGVLSRLRGAGVGEGAHLVVCLVSVICLPGDVCEFGVGSGATSALLANELRGTGKVLWLYDTFAGLPAPTAEDELIDDVDHLGSMAAYQGRMRHSQVEVLERLRSIGVSPEAFRVVTGLFDETIADERLPEQVCFAYVDFDFYAPIRAALEKLVPRLSPGGIIIVDDYGYFSNGAQKAVDQFLAAYPGLFDLEVPNYCYDKFAILRHVAG